MTKEEEDILFEPMTFDDDDELLVAELTSHLRPNKALTGSQVYLEPILEP